MSMQTTVGDTATSPRPWQHLAVLRERARGRFKPTLLTRIERYGIRRDLTVPRDMLPTRVPIALRPMTHADVDILFPDDATALSPKDRQEVVWRRMFIDKAGIANGIVGVDERNGRLCAALWRFWHSDNALVRRIGGFPHLNPEDILIEGHYAPRPYRGVGVMPVVTLSDHQASELARVAIRLEANLAFIGLGVQPPTPTWGNMLAGSRAFLDQAVWLVTFPGLTISMALLGINLLGDALRDRLDPRMRRRVL